MVEDRLDCLLTHFKLLKMGNDFDEHTESECFSSCYGLYLSVAGCECSSDRYYGPKHAN
jgi:histone demethylase JARID1